MPLAGEEGEGREGGRGGRGGREVLRTSMVLFYAVMIEC